VAVPLGAGICSYLLFTGSPSADPYFSFLFTFIIYDAEWPERAALLANLATLEGPRVRPRVRAQYPRNQSFSRVRPFLPP
jgi:hypothetical protein